ncbi:CocE/NonD family hydrolase [Alloacidobacterium dinghuense]|uniref:CocE/NonD family hydrolase n=1 Tax=Alloacidobacterium dinghuense TaxID=2763107 RepID=A0A7G8BGY1_9BACT|nr:CocE/NonD family hydrolase [Alloacidobacterium dinghuense]QNI31801.1 CocE/NonD family hydrolase [Alloacidobacterium dinghuense]
MKRVRSIYLILLCLLASLLPVEARAQEKPATPEEDYVKAHYTKYEYRIPMRDGVHLFTSVYVPKDTSQSYPFMIDRTPYSVAPYGEDQYKKTLGPSDEFEKAGYIFVYQDVRGRYLSEGKFVEMHPHIVDKKSPQDVDDSSDMYDTLEYLLKHVQNNNGKAGIWGISYPGFYTSASIIDSHPALKAASPQAPMTNLFKGDDAYHGGAFMLGANFGFYTSFKPFEEPSLPKREVPFQMGTPNGYEFYLQAGATENLDKKYLKGSNPLFNDQLFHTTYDEYWKERDLSQHMKNVKCAVLVVGGWFDAEDLSGPYNTFYAINKFNPETATTLVEGPWVHGGWARNDGDHLGDAQFNAKTAEFFRRNIQFPFFEYYLKGKGSPMPKAYVFETGTNVWRTYDAWPPAQAKPKMLYFHAGGKLSLDPPVEKEGSDDYISDPSHPVPFVGYTTDTIPQRYMVDDQRFASSRTDVLVYQTDPLTEDVTIAGPISPKLKVATTGTDSDFVVKLIDVYPNDYPDPDTGGTTGKRVIDTPPLRMGGYQQLLRGEPMRAKFRDSWEKPETMTPGKMAEVDFSMPDLNHTFRKGHCIMVQVQSSWFPLVDRNPQTFTDIPHAKPEDFKKATETVFRDSNAASGVEVLVLPQP